MGNFLSKKPDAIKQIYEHTKSISNIPYIHSPILISVIFQLLCTISSDSRITKLFPSSTPDTLFSFIETVKDDSEYLDIDIHILINEILNINIPQNIREISDKINCTITKTKFDSATDDLNINTLIFGTLIFKPKWGSIITISSVTDHIMRMVPTYLRYYNCSYWRGISLPFEGGFNLYVMEQKDNYTKINYDEYIGKITESSKILVQVNLPMWSTNFDYSKFNINNYIVEQHCDFIYKQSASFINLDQNNNIKITNIKCKAKLDITANSIVNDAYFEHCNTKFHCKKFYYAITNYDGIIIFCGIKH